jgi:hypothetical protein
MSFDVKRPVNTSILTLVNDQYLEDFSNGIKQDSEKKKTYG